MHVCILSSREQAAERYTEALNLLGLSEVVVAADIMEMFDNLTSQAICGVALDIPTIVKASEQGKQLINNIAEIYPMVKLNWAPGKEIRAVGNHFLSSKEPPLESFALACRTFNPRSWRKHERIAKNINIYWRMVDPPDSERHRAFTIDVSKGGYFVCELDPPPEKSIIEIEILSDGRKIQAVVSWSAKWGEMEKPPGFGCQFL